MSFKNDFRLNVFVILLVSFWFLITWKQQLFIFLVLIKIKIL